jgi:threonylcarbamoyladenosine tRNA methylthiotransferase MtaB
VSPVTAAAFGCKVSRIEALALSGELEKGAFPRDVIVVHTCTVTGRADRDVKRTIRRLRREQPDAALVASGCLARRDPESLARMPEVDLVAGFASGAEIARLLAEREAGLLPMKIAWPPPSAPVAGVRALAVTDPDRTRAFLKVQDGCERRCSFCVVPSIRGPERSADPGALEDEVRRLGATGVPEVVFAGVHLANYGKDRGTTLTALLRRLEDSPPGCRVRLSSLEPMEAGEELIDLVASSHLVVPHLHLPLQSGSDAVLARMRRGITSARFRALVFRALRANGRLHLATDLIAGFPGESDAECGETKRLAEEIPFASLHVFPFSPRSGTHAAALHSSSPVPRAATAARAAALRRHGERHARDFRRRSDGTTADAVVLRGGRALTDHYLEARLAPGVAGLPPGTRLSVRLSAHPETAALTASAPGEAGTIPPP